MSCLGELNKEKERYKAIAQRFLPELEATQVKLKVEKAKFESSKLFGGEL